MSASVVIDDSGNPNPPAGPIAFGSSLSFDFQISGLTPAPIRFGVLQNTTLNTMLLTGAGDKTFYMQAASQGMALTLNAGGGVNTLDYSSYVNYPALVSWYRGEGNANDVTGANPGVVHNGVSFAPVWWAGL